MKKLSIIVAAGIVTFSVTSGAQATCNLSPQTLPITFDSGLTGLTLANDRTDDPDVPFINVFTNVITNAGKGDGGEDLNFTFIGTIECAGTELETGEDDPSGAQNRQ